MNTINGLKEQQVLSCYFALTHSLTHSITRSLTHPLTHSLKLSHSLTLSLTQTKSLSYSLTHAWLTKTPYNYLTFLQSNNDSNWYEAFENNMIENGEKSSVSRADRYPEETIDLPFTFDYFGNKVSQVTINPSGVLSVPPLYACNKVLTHSCSHYWLLSHLV